MMHKTTVRIATLAIAALVASSVAEAAPKRHAKPQPKIDPVRALVVLQDANRYDEGENLAAACRRTNFEGLAYALSLNESWLNNQKAEFETSDEYAQRSGKLADALGGVPIIICQPLNDNEDAPFSYKADSEQFEGRLSTNQNVWRDVKQLGRFKTKTMMGVPFIVSASSEMNFDASLEIKSDRRGCLKTEQYGSGHTYTLAVPRADAPYVKASGYLVYVARLKAPYVSTESDHDTASLDDPYEVITNGITTHVAVDRLIVVDGHGKEWWNCDPKKGPGALPPQPTTDPVSWVVPSDYGSYSFRPAAKGDVGIRLNVSHYSYVTDCIITVSSGNDELDRVTCTYARMRAKFSPATDQFGEPVDGTYDMKVHWGA